MRKIGNNSVNYWLINISELIRNGGGDQCINPFKKSCPSFYVFEAIQELAKNQFCSIEEVCHKTIVIMKSVTHHSGFTEWEAFCSSPKYEFMDKLKDIVSSFDGHRFKRKLQLIGCSISYMEQNKVTYICLNTKKTTKSDAKPIIKNAPKPSFASKVFAYIKSIVAFIRWF